MAGLTSRRSVLGATGVLAVGVGAMVAGPASEANPEIGVRGAPGLPSRLWCPDVRLARPDRQPGTPTRPRAVTLPFGDLVTRTQRAAGSFDTTLLAGRRAMHLHRIDLAEGSLVGLGEADGDGVFTIVGASGRFTGAGGAYRITRDDDRSIEFTFHTKAV